MTTRTVILLLLLVSVAAGQSGLRAPSVGLLLDEAGNLRPVWGLRGNFIIGEPYVQGAVAAAFTRRGGLVKTDDEMLVFNSQGEVVEHLQAPTGPAVLGTDNLGRPALAYFPTTGELLIRSARRWRTLPLELQGEVVAGRVDSAGLLSLALRRGSELWLIRLWTRFGTVRDEELVASTSGPALLLPGSRLLFSEGNDLVLRLSNWTETRIPGLPEVTRMAMMGTGWVHVECDGPDIALRIDHGTSYYLPERPVGGVR